MARHYEIHLEADETRKTQNGAVVPYRPPRGSEGTHGAKDEPGPRHGDTDDVALESEKARLAEPPLYKVVLINDDYTPMEFVVDVLCSFFNMNVEKATQVMLKVHTEGKGVCGVFSRDVAETKVEQVNEYSRECEHPLLCNVEVDQ